MNAYEVNGFRVVDLTKKLDPEAESRRCKLYRFNTGGRIPDFHTNMDLMSHLGTHVECPYHHREEWKDVAALPLNTFLGRAVYVNFTFLAPNSYILPEHLNKACEKVQEGDIVILDSDYRFPPFTELTNTKQDKRLFICKETAQWLKEKKVKCVGFGEGVSIENSNEDVCAFHDILMVEDIVFLEVLCNLQELSKEVFFMSYSPIPIKGLDSCPIRAYAIEGLPGFDE